MNIAIIGTGNVATAFAILAKNCGHSIIEIRGRNIGKAELLARKVQAGFGNLSGEICNEVEIVIIALSDDALVSMPALPDCRNLMVVHTAASVPMDVLAALSKNYGVLYPLQSLRIDAARTPEIPLLIEANNHENLQMLQQFAKTLSENVRCVSSTDRKKLHVAAVFVSNFANHLYALADDYCKKEQLDFSVLVPLITETAERVKEKEPRMVQTGPAIRQDTTTLAAHSSLLEMHPLQRALYSVISESIQKFYQSGN